MSVAWPWITLALLGAYHGLNPGMGWLFALSLGLQQKSRRAILWALAPIGFGHAVAVAATVAVIYFAQMAVSPKVLKIAIAAILSVLPAAGR